MAFHLYVNVHETTTSTGEFTLGGTLCTLAGAVSGAFTFVSQMPTLSTEWTLVSIVQNATTWEVRKARLDDATHLECDDLIMSSTGSNITWGSGTKDVICGLAPVVIESLVDPDNQTAGLVARLSDYTYAGRTLQTSSPNSLVAWTNGDGVGGNPVPNDTTLGNSMLWRTSGATVAQRTMAASMIMEGGALFLNPLSGGTQFHLFGQGSDNIGRFLRLGTSDYELYLRVATVERRVVAAPVPSDPGDDGSRLVARSGQWEIEEAHLVDRDTATNSAGDWVGSLSGLSVSISIPSTGTWDIKVRTHMAVQASGSGSQYAVAAIAENIDAGGATNVAWGGNASFTTNRPMDFPIDFERIGATNGSTYVYTVVNIDGLGFDGIASPRIHTLFAEATLRA